jgi:hypothetical protein
MRKVPRRAGSRSDGEPDELGFGLIGRAHRRAKAPPKRLTLVPALSASTTRGLRLVSRHSALRFLNNTRSPLLFRAAMEDG